VSYRFKPLAELGWGVGIAAGLVILQALVTLDPEAVKDWRTWAVALGGAAIRAGAGAGIDYIRRSMTDRPESSPAERVIAATELDAWRPVVHADCGRTAFLTIAPNNPGETIEADEAIHTDGRPYDVGSDPTCDACGQTLAGAVVKGGVWVAVTGKEA
jgi:hypothetical protein